MRKAGQECPDKPTIPSLEVRKLRARLILEEALETINEGLGIEVEMPDWLVSLRIRHLYFYEIDDGDPVKLADGMADLQVVNLGTAVACGIDLEPVFNEVCRSNESKFEWTPDEIHFLNKKTTVREIGNGLKCVQDEGGKILKGPRYSPANIAPIIQAQMTESASKYPLNEVTE